MKAMDGELRGFKRDTLPKNDNYALLEYLIDSSNEVDLARLDDALESKKITEKEYIALSRKLAKKNESIVSNLAFTAKNLDAGPRW